MITSIPPLMLIIMGVSLWVGALVASLICRKTKESQTIVILALLTSLGLIICAL